MRFGLPRAFPLYAGRSASLCSVEPRWKTQAIPAATLMSNYAISLAAFGFVAFVLSFVHPASQASRAGAQQAAAAAEVPIAKVAAELRSRLAAPK